MNKPANYDNTPVGGYQPPELGGHRMIIRQVVEMKSKTGKDMIMVQFDFAEDDVQPWYFSMQYRDDARTDKKWPNQATQYILSQDENGRCSRSFKTFVSCVESSNPGFVVQWGDTFCQCLKSRKIGGVFGEQMDYYNGGEKKKRVLRWFCSLDKVAEASIPEISETKAYKESRNVPAYGPIDSDGFMNIPDGVDDEGLPFN